MTDTASQFSPPEGHENDQPLSPLACFDRDGTAVFASLCRSMAGDRRLAADVLRRTFVQLDEARGAGVIERTDFRNLVLAAHRVYLSDRRADDDFYDGDPPGGPAGDEPAWVLQRWGPASATLSGLTARERTALNLHLVEDIDLGDIAELLQQPVAEVTALIESGLRALQALGAAESSVDILRHAEMWLGDDERDDVRTALGAETQRPGSRTDEDPERTGRSWRPSNVSAVVAIVVGALAAAGVGWLRSLPDEPAPTPAVIDEVARPETVARQVVTDGATVDVTPVPNALAETEVIVMATALTDPAVVVPDAIIKYSDGKVGLSWHGPCNRPAIAVAITNTGSGAVVELTTGEFPVLSCIGMPSRWTAVVESALPLAEGPVRPVVGGGVLTTFDGFVERIPPTGSVKPISEDAGYSSALVDDGNQPWVYGLGCSSRSARYQSPIGAIFEIRTETADPDSYSSSDAVVCNNLSSRPVLAGPRGAIFPHSDAVGGSEPIDCTGPIGSQTDVPSQRPYNARFYDGDWSTWDGCLVRTDVIFSESLFETCAGADLRTITFSSTLGERITSAATTMTYIRDPDRKVAGTRPPLLTYLIAPTDLSDTGLRYRDQQLWLSPRGMDAIYVRIGEQVERWPLLTDEVTCA